jgi:hypothetical protein
MAASLMLSLSSVAVHAQDNVKSVMITLNELNDSGVTGSATLTAQGDQTVVELKLTGLTGDHPDHIHNGTCADPVPEPTYPLNDVVLNPSDPEGRSTTTVDVELNSLLEDDYLILVHKSHEEINTYVACGDIVPMEGVGGASTLPSNGAGPLAEGDSVGQRLTVLGGFVGLLTMLGLGLRRRTAHRAA